MCRASAVLANLCIPPPSPVGQDATKAFADVGHSESARELKEKYYIGDLSGASCGSQCSPVSCIGLPLEQKPAHTSSCNVHISRLPPLVL